MLQKNVLVLIFLVLLLITVSAACAPLAQQRGQGTDDEVEKMLATANAEDAFDVTQLERDLHMAVEVEITAEGVTPVGVSIVRGPARPNSAQADLSVRAFTSDAVVSQYTIADPRLVEVEGEGWRQLPSARIFVHVPLDTDLRQLLIVPVAGREADTSPGGAVDLQPLMKEACKEQPDLDPCKDILQE
jgi:hypothetical protein